MKKRKPVSFTMDETDMAQLNEVSERLQVNHSRAMSLAINFLHTLLKIECNMTEPKPRSYEEVVLPPSLLKTNISVVEEIGVGVAPPPTEPPPMERKRGGWPRGKKRGPRKVVESPPLLRIVR